MAKLFSTTIRLTLNAFLAYIRLLMARIDHDRLTMVAGHLTYVSLLSLVPLIAVMFALLSLFPVFAAMGEQIKHFVFSNFIPTAGETIQSYMEQFVANSSQMTAIGTCGLIVTALLLISSIDQALNQIWRSEQKRSAMISFAVYWMVLTLGPVLAGASLAISTYLISLTWLHFEGVSRLFTTVLSFFPFVLSMATFWLMYSVVPTVRVRVKDAAIGALVAGLLFELGKKLFGLYVVMFPSYQLVYGVLAVIPLLFVWVYVSWCIVLFGAEITASLGEFRGLRKQAEKETTPLISKQNQSE